MKRLQISKLLEKYLDWVNNDNEGIQFLKENSIARKKISGLVEELKKEVIKVEKPEGNLDWYEVHQIGRKLWEELASAALNYIDKDSKGNAKLFKFLDKATEFEDILYGLDKYYRDHTLHSLWVYIIGEHILRDCGLKRLHKSLNWYLYNDIEPYGELYSYPKDLINHAVLKKSQLNKKVNKYRDAVWCIMALCHDLGYSLAKLKDLNEIVKDTVKFFDIPNIRQIGYFLDVEHQHLAAQFLELMAMDVRIVPSEDYEKLEKLKEKLKKKNISPEKYKEELEERTLIKCYRDDSTYWRLCRAVEKKQHGILGAYLIYKILGIFADTSVRGPAEEWGLEDDEVVANIIRGDVLFAIAQHEFDFAHSYELNSLADILVLADELEEFSRYGRQLWSRKYYATMAWSSIDFKTERKKIKRKLNKSEKEVIEIYITINISYKVAKEHDLVEFFSRKAENLIQFYSLDPKEDEQIYKPVFFRIKNIKMIAEQNKCLIEFYFSKGPEHQLSLQKRGKKRKILPVKEYTLQCHDDKLQCVEEDLELRELLKKWFRYKDNKMIGYNARNQRKKEGLKG